MDFLDQLLNFFVELYRADKRPEARRFTIGCLVIALVVVALIVVIFLLWEQQKISPAR